MKRLMTILCFVLCTISATAQVVITGQVRELSSGKGVSDVNVMLQNPTRTVLYCYTISDVEGNYSVTYDGDASTLEVVITGFNIKGQSRTINAQSQRVDFEVEYSDLEIKEVVVRAASVERRSDTLTYNVASFITISDHSIGDVLRRMPGISVGDKGDIKYNGKPISKLYIEGMDMLGGKYGIATNNIQAKDIARVELYENHEPVKALRGVTMPTKAALNIRLKESAKGTWSGTAQLGGGYKPWMWNGELSVMYFGKRFQTISIYKTNNMGADVSREFRSHYGGFGGVSTMLGVHRPTAPNITESRYLDNNIHAVSLNAITKLNDDLELSCNANYIHDLRQADGSSITTYYMPESQPVVITERTSVGMLTDRCDLALTLSSNTEKHYLSEKLSFGGEWNRDRGVVDSDGDRVSQYFKLPTISISNNLYDVHRWEEWVLNFNSDISYDTQPAQLEIRPMLYKGILDGDEEYPNAIQTLYNMRLIARNHLSTSLKLGRWNIMLSTQLNADVERMESSLNAANDISDKLATAPTLRNDILYSRLDFVLTPSLQYSLGSRLMVQADLPLDLMWLYSEDRVRNSTTENALKLLFEPQLSISSSITPALKLSARASYNEHYGSLYDSYAGYIMTDYRMIQRKAGDISQLRSQMYGVELSYGNVVALLFAGIEANYFSNYANLMYNTHFDSSLSEIEAINIPNRNSGYSVRGNVSKRFDVIATTVNLAGGYMQSWSDLLRESVIMPSQYSLITAELGFNTRITKAVRVDYKAMYNRSMSTIANDTPPAINLFKQSADIDFIIAQRVICRIGAEHFLNSAIEGGSRNTIFVDASIRFKHKRMEYSVEARNILNNSMFMNASNSNSMDYVYSYSLRPASVIFKVKFSFR